MHSFTGRRRCAIGTYKRLPRGKQKSHDEFRDWTYRALLWIKHNWITTVELAGVAVAAFAIVIAANAFWQHRSRSAAEGFYSATLLERGSEAQVEKLQELAEDYSRTPAGRQAMMALGGIYLEHQETDKAIEDFRRLAGRSRNQPALLIAALHRMAEAMLAKGDAQGAAEVYLKAASDPANLIGPESRLRAAAAFEEAGDPDRAAALYRQVIQDAGETDRAVQNRAEERLLWLIAEHKVER